MDQTASARGAEDAWCYLDAQRTSQGPFPVSYLQSRPTGMIYCRGCTRTQCGVAVLRVAKVCGCTISYTFAGLQQAGYFHDETLFWKEGQPEWLPLKALDGLRRDLLVGTPPVEAPAEAQGASVSQTADPPADELSSFMAEISAIEAEVSAWVSATKYGYVICARLKHIQA